MDKAENDIIEGIRKGEESAFRFLFDSYYTRLVLFARKYTNDMDIARDQVQELFMNLYVDREKILIRTSIKSYLYSSVRNSCLNYLAHQQVREKHRKDTKRIGNGFNPEIEENIDAAELELKIHEIVNTLPRQCRQIYIKSRVEGKRNKEIAEELGLSVRTVETQVSKALKALRDNLLPLQE